MERTLLEVPIAPSGNLALVQFEDGMLCILKGSEPVAGCLWREHELDKAVEEFRFFADALVPPMAPAEGIGEGTAYC